jgi:hypothetical protein
VAEGVKQYSLPSIGLQEGAVMRYGRWLLLLALAAFLAAPARSIPLPASTGAPAVGKKAPDFRLPDSNGTPVMLSRLYAPGGSAKGSWVLLVFYRGYW